MYNIVVLISGSGSNLQAIIDLLETNQLDAQISAVISNRDDAYGLERAQRAGIVTKVLDHKKFNGRENFDQSLAKLIDLFEPDLIVLAGFMRILSDAFVEKFSKKLINIHPSLLPKYKGLHTHQRALDAGDKQHGASVHFVIPELDAGTVIMQGIVSIKGDDTESTLANRVHAIEHIIYPKSIELLILGELKLIGEDIIHQDHRLKKPLTISLDEDK